ncbi:hypothetical protein BON30_17785 [Cystobacter ferrugineus]|uniref:Uncharacterized protein n=1 Tax=Cystobacter ferrugineus TaxID=83449 RepID=A0A1L9BAS4_9BACT|nr:hypothetical protein BON30_17785 [Cystobacter ferrugineus]
MGDVETVCVKRQGRWGGGHFVCLRPVLRTAVVAAMGFVPMALATEGRGGTAPARHRYVMRVAFELAGSGGQRA